jgi:hypothetical protein
MGHGKTDEDVLVLTADSWHGREDLILPRGTSVEEGTDKSNMDEIVWEKRPLYVEVEPGVFLPFGNKQALARLPNVFTDQWHFVDTRIVRDYEIINNDFLIELAKELAQETGWTFEGCGTLRRNELSFIQLRIGEEYLAGGRMDERHTIRFMYGDDKSQNSGFAGINYTRIQCMNTFMVAVNEDSILRVSHRDDPETRWRLVNAQAVEVVKAVEEQNKMLDLFYFHPVSSADVVTFIEQVFPLPGKPRAVVEMEQAQELVARGLGDGIDISALILRGERAQQRHTTESALLVRRRNEFEAAYAKHNARYIDSAHTLYALFQALTWMTNHGENYRGDAKTGILFGGKRAQDIDRGYDVLVEMLG